MGNLLIAFLLAVGASAWIYSKVYKNNGGLGQRALIAAGVSGLIIFIVAWTLLSTFIH